MKVKRGVRPRHLVAGVCVLVALTSLTLRIRAGLARDALPAAIGAKTPAGSWTLPEPRDYVLYPEVAPGEEAHGPERIIALAPSVTETVCALGLKDRLAGRTQFCQYPPIITSVPVVGGIMDTNLEMIRALEPNLVLTTFNSGGLNPKLEALGLRHVSVPHESLEDVFVAIERAGRFCDRPATARQLAAAIRADLERLQRAARALHDRPLRVLIVLGELPVPLATVWVAGPGSFLDDLLRMTGHRNAAADILQTAHGEIPLERLVVLDPEVILTFPTVMPTPEDMNELYGSWSRVGAMQAIQQRRVRAVGGPEWLSAGPRIAVGLHRLLSALAEYR